ncbi:MAG: hypothetical protein JWM64_2494 [Frankiales bacterium]|nr:hypothetical protein [Frankiales bacterium]
MRRKTFDALLTAGGLVLAVVLLVAGGLLTWGSTFVADQVKTQLAAERIFIPTVASGALDDPAIKPYLTQYAGQQLTTGAQAEAYADHFIGVHVKAVSGGRTYAEIGDDQNVVKADIAAAKAAGTPTTALDAKLAGLNAVRDTVFKGETLRGLLLNAYAFGTMGRIAGIAAVSAFAGAAVMLLLSVLGLFHFRRSALDATVHLPGWHPEAAAV